jgi:quinoprotein dehydrogenase-associated probable ABC transporter substrate-binding protein
MMRRAKRSFLSVAPSPGSSLGPPASPEKNKSFLVLFFKKELFFLSLACLCTAARAEDAPPDRVSHSELRVCADPSNLPFSNDKQEGFENKVAQRLAHDLNESLSFYWFPDSQGFVKATIRSHKCDLIIGTVEGNEGLETTKPYYTTGYMLVSRTADNIKSTSIGDPALQGARIGLIARTPPTDLVVQHNLLGRVHPYPLVVDTRVEHPSQQMLHDLADKKIDIALVWGPYAGFYIKHDNLPLKAVPLDPEHSRVPMRFAIAMAVRPSDVAFLKRVDDALVADRAGIEAVLADYGVPVVEGK